MLRPDEKVSESSEKYYGNIKNTLKSGVSTGIGIAGLGAGAKAASKIMPFLSEYIDPKLAMQAINKINPSIGSFLKQGQNEGLNIKEGLEFVKNKINSKPKEETQEPAKESRNIIEQYSPELFQFITQQVKGRGLDPLQAGALAQNDPKFTKVIEKMMKDHQTPWSSILQSIFGGAQQAQAAQQQTEMIPQQGMQQQQQPGQGQQALMSILQKIQQARGA